MTKRALILTGLLLALPAWAAEAPAPAPDPAPVAAPTVCPITGLPLGPGPWWQSAEWAALHQQVRSAQWALYALETAVPRDEAAVTAKRAEVERLRQELYAQRDRERAQFRAAAPGAVAGAGWAPGAGRRGGAWARGGGRGWRGGGGGRGGYGGQGNPNCPYR